MVGINVGTAVIGAAFGGFDGSEGIDGADDLDTGHRLAAILVVRSDSAMNPLLTTSDGSESHATGGRITGAIVPIATASVRTFCDLAAKNCAWVAFLSRAAPSVNTIIVCCTPG
jgi:hypothetical protein